MLPAPASQSGLAPTRESWLVRLFSGASSDLRHGIRQLGKSRGFASVTLLTLALCIGANTAIFSPVYALMLKPMPFPAPDRIIEIYNTYLKAGLPKAPSNVVQYLDYQQNTSSFAHVGLWSPLPAMFGEETSAARLSGARATGDLFAVLGVKPLLGQFFAENHHRPNEDKVIVLTQSFWETHYREDPGILGKPRASTARRSPSSASHPARSRPSMPACVSCGRFRGTPPASIPSSATASTRSCSHA